MKTKPLLAALTATLLLGAPLAQADSAKGQKIYLKQLKKRCGGQNGAKMAAAHTQDEWEELKENGEFAQEMGTLCPDAKAIIGSERFESSYAPHLYDFFYEFASDSGNVPSC